MLFVLSLNPKRSCIVSYFVHVTFLKLNCLNHRKKMYRTIDKFKTKIIIYIYYSNEINTI